MNAWECINNHPLILIWTAGVIGLTICSIVARMCRVRNIKNAGWSATHAIAGWGTLADAQTLLAACKACDTEFVKLSADDAAFVTDYS